MTSDGAELGDKLGSELGAELGTKLGTELGTELGSLDGAELQVSQRVRQTFLAGSSVPPGSGVVSSQIAIISAAT